MDWTTIGKYAMGTALLGSVGALTYLGKVDATTYVTMVTAVLAGLGFHVISNKG